MKVPRCFETLVTSPVSAEKHLRRLVCSPTLILSSHLHLDTPREFLFWKCSEQNLCYVYTNDWKQYYCSHPPSFLVHWKLYAACIILNVGTWVTKPRPLRRGSCYDVLLTWASCSLVHSRAPEEDAWSADDRSLQRRTPITTAVVQLTAASSPVNTTQSKPTPPFCPSNTVFRDFYTLHNETVSHKSVTTHKTFFITINSNRQIIFHVPVVSVNVLQKLYTVSNIHRYCQCSPPFTRFDKDNLLQELGRSIQERCWRRDAAVRTVPATDRQPSEATVPTAACLAAYLFSRPWIRSARHTKPARQPMGKRVRGKKRVNRENERNTTLRNGQLLLQLINQSCE